MACEYFVNGEWLTETQFKKVLNDGLLDQLIINQNFNIPGFDALVNEDVLAKAAGKVKVGPVRLRVRHKADVQVNNEVKFKAFEEGEVVGEAKREHPHKNIKKVIDKSNDQIKTENTRLKTDRPANPFYLLTKIGGKLRYGERLRKTVLDDINESEISEDIINNLEEGQIYLMVPSAYGLYPLAVKSHFLGETKVAPQVKEDIKALFKLSGKEFTAKAKEITRFLYKTTIEKEGDSIKINTTKKDKEVVSKTFNNPKELTSFILGDWSGLGKLKKDAQGKESTNKGLLAHVDHLKINKKVKNPNALSNDFYAENNFITTDLYTEGGNFFNSTSFVVEAFAAIGETKEIVSKVTADPNLIKATKETEKKAIEKNAEQNVVSPKTPNQETKKDENPLNDRTPEEVFDKVLYAELPGTKGLRRIAVPIIPKGNTIEMGIPVIESLTGDTWTPIKNQPKKKNVTKYRQNVLDQFNELKKEYGTKEEVEPEGMSWMEPPKEYKESGLFKESPTTQPQVNVESLNIDYPAEVVFYKDKAEIFLNDIPKWYDLKNNSLALIAIGKKLNIDTSNFENAYQKHRSHYKSFKKYLKAEGISDETVFYKKEDGYTYFIDKYGEEQKTTESYGDEIFISKAAQADVREFVEAREQNFQFMKTYESWKNSLISLQNEIKSKLSVTPQQIQESIEDEIDDYDYGDEADGELGFGDAKTRLEYTKEDASLWNKEKETKWFKDKLNYELLDKNVFSKLEDLQEYLPEETYEMLLEARKNGKYLHGIFTKAAVHLSENAFEGTGYHEAFHVVFNLGLNLEQRLSILEEAAERFQKEIIAKNLREGKTEEFNMTDIEEFLADKFMEYVQADEATQSSFGQRVGKFFKALIRGLRLFFNKNAKVNVDDLFRDIQLGVYKNRIEFKNTDLSKIDPEDIRMALREDVLDPAVEYEGFQYLEYKLFSQLDKYRKDNPEIASLSDPELIHHLSKSEGGVYTVFGIMLHSIFSDLIVRNKAGQDTSDLSTIINVLTNNRQAISPVQITGFEKALPIFKEGSTKMLEKFTRYLRHRGININFDSIETIKDNLDEESPLAFTEEDTNAERWQKAHIEINPRTTLSQLVKRRLGTIPKMVVNKAGEKIHATNRFRAPIYYSEAQVFGYIGSRITDSRSPSDMVKKLRKLEDDKPFVSQLLNMLDQDAQFKTDLYVTLGGKTFQKYLMAYEKAGEYSLFYSNRQTVDNIIKETLIANFLVQKNQLFKEHTEKDLEGQRNFEDIDLVKVAEQSVRLGKIKEAAKEAGNAKQINAVIEDFSKFLLDNHINITENQLREIWNPVQGKATWKNVRKVIDHTENIFSQLANNNNPFLEMRVKEGDYKSVLHNFTIALKPGLEKELIAAFRNGGNKSVYSIQLANYLTKLISRLTDEDSLKVYLEEIASDPLLSAMPFFEELMDEDGATPSMDELEVAVLDSLARKGKFQNVEYEDASDIELEAIALAAFHNNGSKNYGYFKLPTPADSPQLPLLKSKKYSNQEVLDKLLKVAKAEIGRIEFFSNLPKNSRLRNIPNYKDKASSFQILSFLNDKIDVNNFTDEDIIVAIEEFIYGEFLELQKKEYQKAGVISSFAPGINGKIIFAEKVITNSKIKDATNFFINYLLNSYYMNTQMTTIFAGDPAFYKGTVDYQKRYKQIVSPGDFTNHEIVNETYTGMIFNDVFVPTLPEVAEHIIKQVKDSNLSSQKKKEIIAFWEEKSNPNGKEEDWNNITDAATFVSLDRQVQKLVSLGKFTDAHEAALERIEAGIESVEDAALFQVEKPFMFTKMKIDGIEVPFQLKNSEVLLTKSMAYRTEKDGKTLKYPQLAKMYDILNDPEQGVDFIAFESAVKVGAIGAFTAEGEAVTKDGSPRFNELVLGAEGQYELNAEPALVTLYHEDWRRQQENPEHYIDESGNFGSQLRHLAISDLKMQGDYTIGNQTLKGYEVARLYQNLIVENLKTSFASVEKMFLDKDGEIDYQKIMFHLREELRKRDLDEDYFEATELIDEVVAGIRTGKKVPVLPLWHPLTAYKVESLLNSFFKNNITKQKINGGNMVNATSYGVSHTLKWIPETNTMQALLPWWSKKYFPKNEKGEIDLETLPKELTKLIGYRIPTEDKYSIFNIEVKGFTDSTSGGMIVLPVEATTAAGLDFDIDKLFMMIPEYRIEDGEVKYKKYLDKNSSAAEIVDAIFETNASFEDFVERYVPEKNQEGILERKRKADQEKRDAILARNNWKENVEFRETVQAIKRLDALRKKETNLSRIQAIKAEIAKLEETLSELDTFDGGVAIADSKYRTLKKDMEKAVEAVVPKEDYESFNTTKTRNNKLLELMIGIMQNPNTLLSVADVGNFEQLKEIGSKTRLLSIPDTEDSSKTKLKTAARSIIKKFRAGKISTKKYREELKRLADELDTMDFNINYPSTQLTIFRRNMTGKQLVGVFANHNAHHAKAQHTQLRLVSPIRFDSLDYQFLNKIFNEDSERISKSLASKLAAVVDNTKEPISAFLNLNLYTSNLVALMSRLGVKEDTIFALVNQPIIKELTTRYLNEKGSLKEQKKGISSTIQKWERKLKEQKIPEDAIDFLDENGNVDLETLNLTLEELEASLDANGSQAYYITQYKVLKAFSQLQNTAQELHRITQASRIDTESMGPSNADNFVMINKQQRLLDRANPLIEGERAFFFEEDKQLINPAFNKYAWLMPIGIMNKILPSIGVMDSATGKMAYSLLGRIKNYFSDLKGEYSLTSAEARRIDSFFMTYVGSRLPFFEKSQAEDILNKVPEELQDFKAKYPDSIYVQFLEQFFTKDATRNVPMRRIEYYATGKTPLDHEYVRRMWKHMLTSENLDARNLAMNLVKYSYFSNGYAFSPFSFFNMVPVEFWKDSFANLPQNRQAGLKTPKGHSFTDLVKQVLDYYKNDEILDDNGQLNQEGDLYNFIKQMVQNSAEKSPLIQTLPMKDIEEREFSPKNVYKLEENEVYVFGTTADGQHNVATSGYAFRGNAAYASEPSAKGVKGKWSIYGETGKVMEGAEGKGFGLRMQKAVVKDGRIVDILGYNQLEKEERQRLIDNFRTDFSKLVVTAENEENKDRKFIVGPLEIYSLQKDKYGKGKRWNKQEIEKVIRQVYEQMGIPDNIVLPRNIDPRISKIRNLKNGDTSLMISQQHHKEYMVNGRSWPDFFKISDGKTVKLYELNIHSLEKPYLEYKRIPILGTSNFVKEFDFGKAITESVVPKIIKKTVKQEEEDLALLYMDAPTQEPDDMSLFMEPTKEAIENVTKKEDVEDVLDLAEDMAGIPVDLTITPEKSAELRPVSYKDYTALVKKAGETPMPIEAWAMLTPTEQEAIIRCKKL